METVRPDYFLKMIQHLREKEEVMLYGNIITISPEESVAAAQFLKAEYEKELSGYPLLSPVFNAEAALWAARIVYVSAQLLLYRENKQRDLALLLPVYEQEHNAAAVLSADLCLRFLPDMLIQLKLIDTEDPLIELLEKILVQWHYSGVAYSLDTSVLDFTTSQSDTALFEMYCERIFENKKLILAQHPVFRETITSQLGMYGNEFWKDFKMTTTSA